MKVPRITRRTLAVALAPAALAGAILAFSGTALAGTQPAQARTHAATSVRGGWSTGFDVHNATDRTLSVYDITGTASFQNDPKVGDTLPPGGTAHFEINWVAFNNVFTKVRFSNPDLADVGVYYDAYMMNTMLNDGYTYCSVTWKWLSDCTPAYNSDNHGWNAGTTVTLLPPQS